MFNNKIRRNRFICFIITIAMIIATLAGCSGKNTTSTVTPETGSRQEVASGEAENITDNRETSGDEKITEEDNTCNTEEPSGEEDPSNVDEGTTSDNNDSQDDEQGTGGTQKPTEQGTSETKKPTQESTEQATSGTQKPTEQATSGTQKPTEQATTGTQKPTEQATTGTQKPTEQTTTATQQTTSDDSNLTSTQKKAKAITDTIVTSSMTDFQKVMAIHEWMVFNLKYDYTYSIYDVDGMLDKRTGVCDAYAKTFLMMAELVGLEATRVTGTANNGEATESHAWNQVKINGVWYNLDVTWDDPGNGDTKYINYDYFLISDSVMGADHFPSSAKQTCSSDYDRRAILKAAANSGYRTNAAYVENNADTIAAVNRLAGNGCSEIELWYYDTSVTTANMFAKLSSLLYKVPYMFNPPLAYAPSNGVTKYILTPSVAYSEWNNIKVVSNMSEFSTYLNSQFKAGNTTVYIRLEPSTELSSYNISTSYGWTANYYVYGGIFRYYTITRK